MIHSAVKDVIEAELKQIRAQMEGYNSLRGDEARLIAALDAISGEVRPMNKRGPSPHPRGKNVEDTIIKFMTEYPIRPYTIDAICVGTGLRDSQVTHAMNRIGGKGYVAHVGTRTYEITLPPVDKP